MYTSGGTSPLTRSVILPCQEGYYCLNGVRVLCPAGRFGCSGQESNPLCSGGCDPGYYCTEGSKSPKQFECGMNQTAPASVYCPYGSAAPVSVGVGNFTSGSPLESTRSLEEVCAVGSYCEAGKSSRCPEGRFGNSTGLWSSVCSGVCDDGCYCEEGSEMACASPCPAGFVCRNGTRVPCAEGSYNELESQWDVAACVQCSAGRYNPATGSNSSGACIACVSPEGSGVGSRACWPGVLSVTADNPPPIVVGLSVGDTVTIRFTRATNQPDVSSVAKLMSVVSFSSSIGSCVVWSLAGQRPCASDSS